MSAPRGRSLERSRGASPASQRFFTAERWAPSRREKRKYASLFQRSDGDQDGLIRQPEAFQLAQRSGLDPNVLETAWALSDVDRDGTLTYHEFICFIHLITSVTRGARMPSLQEGLPPQLLNSLMNLEPLEILVAEREESRSRSRSVSPMPGFLSGTPGGTPRSEKRTFTDARWAPSRREKRKYASLFERTDWDKDGFISQGEAFQLAQRSGLDPNQLETAWALSDVDRDGTLTYHEFICFIHLITSVTRGARMPSVQEGVPPQLLNSLMNLEPLEILVAEREESRSRSRSVSPMPGFLSGTPGGTPRSEKRSFTDARWAPSRREKRKYASLFERTDWDKDGFISQSEAFQLAQRSGLDPNTLETAWGLSDVERDGMLTYHEFICFIHLITSVTRGARMPSLQEGLPPQLLDSLMNLEPLEILVAEREESRSRSRSQSPAIPSFLQTEPPAIGTPRPRSSKSAAAGLGFEGQPGEGHLSPDSETSPQGFPSSADDGFSAAFGADAGAASGDAFATAGFEDFPGAAPAFGGEADVFGAFGAESHSESPKKEKKEKKKTKDSKESKFDDFFQEPGTSDPFRTSPRLGAMGEGPALSAELVHRFQRTLAADREVSKQISQEMHVLSEELRMVQDAAQQVEEQYAQEARQHQQLEDEQRSITQQLAEQQHRLIELRDESRALNLENLSLRRDRNHLSQEVEFLQNSVGSERRALESLDHMNQVFDSYNKEMEAAAELLTRQRKELPLAKEQQLLRQEERQNNELRNLLERRKREQATVLAHHHEVQQKHQLIRAMQSDDLVTVSAFQHSGAPPERHSWATSLLKNAKAFEAK